MWIMKQEYFADGSSAYAPGTKIFGYNPKDYTGDFWSNDPNFNGVDSTFNHTQYWTENERRGETSRTDQDGNPITNFEDFIHAVADVDNRLTALGQPLNHRKNTNGIAVSQRRRWLI